MIQRHGVPIVALMIFGAELGLPTIVPMEVALLLVGGYSISSLPMLLASLLLVIVADLSGTTVLFLAMRTSGRRLVARLLRRHARLGVTSMARWRHRLGGHDVGAVLLGRAIPLVRMYIPIGAGLGGITPRDYLAGAAPGDSIWAGTPLLTGYLFRGDVHRIAAGYTRVEHVLLVVLAVVVTVVVGAWWIRGSPTVPDRIRRGRAVAGLIAALGVGVYLVALVVANDRAADRGAAALPMAALAVWLGLLAVLALALLGVAIIDVRTARKHLATREASGRAELVGTLAWVGLVSVVGGIMIGLELHYPGL